MLSTLPGRREGGREEGGRRGREGERKEREGGGREGGREGGEREGGRWEETEKKSSKMTQTINILRNLWHNQCSTAYEIDILFTSFIMQ